MNKNFVGIEEIGRSIVEICHDIYSLLIFVGELAAALARAAVKPRAARWRDTLRIAESVGVNAVPIVALIGFLMGLIMAFQAAIPLGQFGAQIFVANLIGLAILRELGPLMTAIVLAGRSGSAFAAELGTMKVREELDALKTMGLEPVPFLVVPRVIAAVLMTPLLTIFADLVGLIGGAVVLVSLGFPLITFWNQVQLAVGYGDLLGGLAKSFVFGILVAAIGCLRGLQTQTGASRGGRINDARCGERDHPDRNRRWCFFGDLLLSRHLAGNVQQEQREIIRVEDLTVAYNGQVILDHVSFTVAAGEVFVILGGSGSGKSTLLKHMIGLYKPASGHIFIDGEDIIAAEGEDRLLF